MPFETRKTTFTVLSLNHKLYNLTTSAFNTNKTNVQRSENAAEGRLERACSDEDVILEAGHVLLSFYSFWSSMERPDVYATPKRKFNRNTSCSPSEASPEENQPKNPSPPT